MEDSEIAIFQSVLLEWYSRNKRTFPWRYTYNPYYVLVSEIMLQQTGAKQVVQVYNDFIDKYPTLRHLSEALYDDVLILFDRIGLRYRAERIINIAKEIMKSNTDIPSTREGLISIKGIGKYTCNAILCFGYSQPYAIVDTNVIRVFDRILDYKTRLQPPHTDKDIWKFAQSILPEKDFVDYNYALLDLGTALRNSNEVEKKFNFY